MTKACNETTRRPAGSIPRAGWAAGAVLAILAGAGAASVAGAQSAGGPYVVDPVVVGGGGATLTGGTFSLSGTIGQPATAQLIGSGYTLYDGFWAPAAAPTDDLIFANGFDP